MKPIRPIVAAGAAAMLLWVPAMETRAALTDDLVVHLTFDNTFNDTSGRGNHGVAVVQPEEAGRGLPITVANGARVGSHALRLQTGQHVRLGEMELMSPPDLQFGDSTDFTISFWIRGNAGAWTSDPSFFGNKRWQSGGNIGYVIAAQGNGGWKWNYTGDAAPRLDTPNLGVITDGAWHNILVSHKRDGDAVFYIDGAEVARIDIQNKGNIDAFLETNIGNEGTGRYGFDNDVGARLSEVFMDDVAVWRRALTAVEAGVVYGAGLQGLNVQQAGAVTAIVSQIFPSAGSLEGPAVGDVFAEYSNIGGTVDVESIRFFYDGVQVAANVTPMGNATRVTYTLPAQLAAGSQHTVRVEALDNNGAPVNQEWSYTVAQYQSVSANFAGAAGSGATPGIRFRTFWAAEGVGTLATTIARAEAQIAGTLIDPFSGLPYFNSANPGPNAESSFVVPVLNFEQAGNSAGRIGGDTTYPGLELAGDYNNFATEAIAYLDLKAGYYRMGVNSDDGFQVRVGRPSRSVLASQVLGAFDGGRGAADSVFDFVAPVDGIYPFRLIHFEGTGGASLEWWHVDLLTGDRILINDPNDARSIKSFAFSAAVDALAYVRSAAPAPGADSARVDEPISVSIVDGTTPVTTGSVQLQVNGEPVNATVSKDGSVISVSYMPQGGLASRTTYDVVLTFGTGAGEVSNAWSFTTRGADQPPAITGHWNFEGGLQPLIGAPITIPNAATTAITQFGTSTDFGIPNINGQPAHVMFFPGASANNLYYTVPHGALPNSGGNLVNRWTVIMDLYFPPSNTQTWFSFMQIDNLQNANDGELFANFADRTGDGVPDGGIGIGGQYTNQNAENPEKYIRRGQWTRVVFAVDKTSDNEFGQGVLSKFIDGVKFQDQTRGADFDGRHALRDVFLLFADEDGESQPVYISSLQVRNYKMSDAEVAALGGVGSAGGIPSVSGQWDFNMGDLSPTIGQPMEYRGDIGASTTFGADTIGGQPASVMGFPGATAAQGYYVQPGILPNGGGDLANRYTLLMDVKFPPASTGRWRGLWQTDTNNANDGELFINTANGIGISGNYSGNIAADTWYRLAFAIDMTKPELTKYINGELVGTQALGGGIDGRFAVGGLGLLFTDEDGETAPGFVNSVQFRPFQLTAEQVAALGAPTAGGIPLDLPYIEVVSGDVPDLAIELLANGQIRITWEAGQGLVLERKGSLSDPQWTAVPGVEGNSATIDPSAASGFYRLRR